MKPNIGSKEGVVGEGTGLSAHRSCVHRVGWTAGHAMPVGKEAWPSLCWPW